MIYLNQAGTSWPKPEAVHRAVREALAASPDSWSARFHEGHARVARALGVSDPERLLLTPGCTSALAVAIADHPWAAGDRILISAMEHHAVARPAMLLEAQGVEVVVVPRAADGPIDVQALENELSRGRVRLVAMTAAANVTGEILPIERIVQLAHAHGALCLLDGAQVLGWLPVDVEALGADLFTFAGHKGPHAPWGIGGLYVSPTVKMTSPAAACEVPAEGEPRACTPLPGYCDVGSVDLVALAGLVAGLDWLDEEAQADRLARARDVIERIVEGLEQAPRIHLLGARAPEARLPTIAFTVEGRPSGKVAAALRAKGVLVASGLQCAPLAHDALDTAPQGAVRLSAGPMTTPDHAEAVLAALGS